MNTWLTASLWMALALAASIVSVRFAISVALTEILFGIVGGNFFHLHVTDWVNFLAGFGSVLLTFLAGAELDPDTIKRHWKESLGIGIVGFLAPFLGAWAYAYYVAHWSSAGAKICGIALSTTSVAVVYAVMIETGFNRTEIGKVILAACFVNDLGTVLALGVAFANYNMWLLLFVIVTSGVLVVTPSATRWFFGHFRDHVSEPEIKFLFVLLFFLGGLAAAANSEAVLTAYLLGLVMASALHGNRRVVEHMRSTVFTMLTPFYFLKAGSYVLLPALWLNLGITVILFLVKMVTKVVGVYPTCLAFGLRGKVAKYTTGMMSTGLTFGTISALFGLSHGYINQTQYTVLVAVVIGSAVIPTMVAQAFFRPQVVIPPETQAVEATPAAGRAEEAQARAH